MKEVSVIEISSSELKRAKTALENLLETNMPSIQFINRGISDAMRNYAEETFVFSTHLFWGLLKCITQTEIVYRLNRPEAVRLLSEINYRLERRVSNTLRLDSAKLNRLPIIR